MGVHALLQKTQKAHVNSERLGSSEAIVYVHAKTGVQENVRAFVEVVSIRGDQKKRRVDETVFSNILLAEKPVKNRDYIIYQGEELIVDSWLTNGELYQVTTLSHEARENRRISHD